MNICQEPECSNKMISRGLCSKHYYRYKRAGTLDSYQLNPDPSKHFLSEVNITDRTAVCQVCGFVGIIRNGRDPRTDKDKWACSELHRSKNRNRIRPREYHYTNGTIPSELAQAERERLTVEQDNKCAICGNESPNGNRLSLDHCHTTGEIRGLLCNACNLGIGYLKDSTDNLKAAIDYLNR